MVYQSLMPKMRKARNYLLNLIASDTDLSATYDEQVETLCPNLFAFTGLTQQSASSLNDFRLLDSYAKYDAYFTQMIKSYLKGGYVINEAYNKFNASAACPDRNPVDQYVSISGEAAPQAGLANGIIPTLPELKGKALYLKEKPIYKSHGIVVSWKEYIGRYVGLAPLMLKIAEIDLMDKIYGNNVQINILSEFFKI